MRALGGGPEPNLHLSSLWSAGTSASRMSRSAHLPLCATQMYSKSSWTPLVVAELSGRRFWASRNSRHAPPSWRSTEATHVSRRMSRGAASAFGIDAIPPTPTHLVCLESIGVKAPACSSPTGPSHALTAPSFASSESSCSNRGSVAVRNCVEWSTETPPLPAPSICSTRDETRPPTAFFPVSNTTGDSPSSFSLLAHTRPEIPPPITAMRAAPSFAAPGRASALFISRFV
mmetsp:Transcript_67522/g.161172  ORF Transcript_67522/g.161172 Transcript_67522/m.161172 type:complete len:231 (-) Transcript_67522:191-883(-)